MSGAGFAGKVALVTGAGQGIGAAVAAAFGREGAVVAAVDKDRAMLEATVAESPGARAYTVDVSSSSAVDQLVSAVEDDLGPVEVLVNVAGVLWPGSVVDSTDRDWRATFAVNADGVYYTSRAVARRMVPRGRGSIITVGSNAAGVPRMDFAAYAASKAAATMFTRCLGLEVAGYGIRCNVVSPGSTDTAMQRALWTDDDSPRRVIDGSPESYRVGIPLRRIAEAADVADAVLFLASDRARHITMQNLYVDGGATLVG